jgi:hypothetical protein
MDCARVKSPLLSLFGTCLFSMVAADAYAEPVLLSEGSWHEVNGVYLAYGSVSQEMVEAFETSDPRSVLIVSGGGKALPFAKLAAAIKRSGAVLHLPAKCLSACAEFLLDPHIHIVFGSGTFIC